MNINDFNPEEIEVVQEKIPAKLNINDIADDEIEVVQAAPKERMTIGKLRQLEEESAALTPRNPIFDAASATGGAVGQVLQQAPGAVVGTAGMLAQFPMDVAAGGASVTAEGLKRLGVISPETATGAQAEYERLANQFGMTVDDLKKAVDYQMGAKKIEDIVAQEAAAQQAQQQAEQEPQAFGIPGANRILDATQGLATMPFQPAITTGQLIGGAIREAQGQPSPDLERMREEPAQEIANALLGRSAFKGLMKRATGKGVVQPTTEVTPEEQARIDRFNAELEAARQESAPKKYQAERPKISEEQFEETMAQEIRKKYGLLTPEQQAEIDAAEANLPKIDMADKRGLEAPPRTFQKDLELANQSAGEEPPITESGITPKENVFVQARIALKEANRAITQAQQAEAKARKANVEEGMYSEPSPTTIFPYETTMEGNLKPFEGIVEGGRESVRNKNIVNEIRNAGLTTKAEVMNQFKERIPDLTMEDAADLLDLSRGLSLRDRVPNQNPPFSNKQLSKPIDQLFRRESPITQPEAATTPVAEPEGVKVQVEVADALETPAAISEAQPPIEPQPRPKTGPSMFGGAQLQNAYEKVEPVVKRGLDIFKKKTKEFIADEEGFYSPEELAKAVKAVKDKFIGSIKRGQSTQVTNTVNTYAKILDRIADKAQGKVGDVRVVDVSTGLGMSKELAENLGYKNYETTEPFPAKGFVPTFKDSSQLQDNAYDFITNNQVLNVVPKEIRDGIVKDIGRALKEGGTAIISTRGKDVMAATTGRAGEESMSLYIPAKDAEGKSYEQYQKGFTNQELKDYVQGLLGDGFEVKTAPFGAAGVEITKTKTKEAKPGRVGMFGAGQLQNAYEKVEPTLKKGADLLFKKGKQAYEAARRNADVTRDMGRVVDLTEKEGKAVETEPPIRKFLKDESGSLSVGPLVDATVDMFNRGRKKVAEMREKREYLGNPIEALQTFLFDRFAPAIKPIEKKLGKAEATKAVNTVDRMLYADNLMKEFAKDSGLAENMAKNLQSVGLNIDHFGAYAEARRILYERDPRGLKSRLTKQQAIDLLDEFQPKQRAVLQQTFEELQENWKKTVVPQITGSEVFDPKINNYIENNDNYSRDVVVDYIGTETGKDARYKNLVEHLKGTEKEKLNPVEQMVLYGRAINQFTSREMAKRQLTEMLDKAGEISADPKEGYEPIRYMHKGEWVEKYAPRRIAQSLMDAPRETHDAIKLVDKIFFNNKYAKWMTRQLINNPGFMLGNSLMLDPVTTWAQLPSFKSKIGYPIVHALTMLEKINAPGVARLSKAFGLDTLADVKKKMTKERIYNIGSLYERTTGEETELGDFMKGIGINENALEFFTGKKKWKATKAYNTFEDMVSKVDQSSKVSLYRYLKAFEPNLGEEKIATMTREMGTPATKRSGLAEPILRRGTLFGNAILQALRATAKNYKDNPAVFTTSNIGVPAALAYGVYQYMQRDPEARQRWNGLSDYQKKNFVNIYTGQDAKDKPIFLSLPLPRVARVFYGMVVDMLENDKGFAQTVGEAVKGLGKGALSELPSGLSRPVGLAFDVGSYMAGKAPYDYYRDSEIIPDQVMKADATLWNKIVGDNKMNDLSTTKAFGSYLLNTYGIGGWFNMDTMKNVPEGYGALKVAPISRLFRMGGSGIPGKLYEAKEDVQKLEARAKILIQKAVEDSVQNEKPIKFTDELKEALTYAPKTIQSQMEKAYVKKMKGMKGSKAFDLYGALKGATMREKLEILKAFKNLNK